ncbi:Leukotoxin [Acaryochloris thomasi RCC1774]|uniref:Leukotoxin n=1 Tax=Acaryochloris thomasi RCC1774 TaxID=1764569 RepID=A0A2W1JRN1_9CYAN|nr:cadherin-like domain-containing protein [Acaryochloris thomasi]PZD73392.1 Leukotoxin [Acaryochloris thomasi RCC1774]
MANSILKLEDLNGSNGFAIVGNGVPYSGLAIDEVGDINGDGLDDIIIGNPAGGADSLGEGYVIFGRSDGFIDRLDLSSLDGSNGFIINGIAGLTRGFGIGSFARGLGDINVDGISDVAIGTFSGDSRFVIFGQSEAFSASIDLQQSQNASVLNVAGLVSSVGDINNDGFNDFIFEGSANNTVNIIFGNGQGFDDSFDGTNVDGTNVDGTNGFELQVSEEISLIRDTGDIVQDAGDINGDGINDLIIGRPSRQNTTSTSHIVFGSSQGFAASLNVANLDGSNGFTLNGSGDSVAVSGVGDFNGDGVDDFVIGAPFASPSNTASAGQSYLVFGGQDFEANFDLADLDGTNGFAINGIGISDQAGYAVSDAGDINGDGFDDIIISASQVRSPGNYTPTFSYGPGQNYVIFGSSGGFQDQLNLADLDGSNGFSIEEPDLNGNFQSSSVSGAGDINGDGIDDLVIGTPEDSTSYVVFGNTAPELDLNGSDDGNNISVNFTGGPIRVLESASILDSNTSTLAGITVTIANPLDGNAETLAVETGGTSITTAFDPTMATLTLSGQDTPAAYQQVLATLTYNNTSASPNSTARRLRIVADDGEAHSNKGSIAIASVVFPPAGELNRLPEAERDAIATLENIPITLNVLDNDRDLNGDALELTNINVSNTRGTVTETGNGTLRYDPSGGFDFPAPGIEFTDRFEYTVSDGQGGTDTAEVIVTVTGTFDTPFELADLDSSSGFTIDGLQADDRLGRAVSNAGDINGDGLDDLAFFSGVEGLIVFGQEAGQPSATDLTVLDGTNGFSLRSSYGPNAISSAGDVNGDGFDDLIISEATYTYESGGLGTYIVFGSDQGFSPRLGIEDLDGTNGFVISRISNAGADSVSADGIGDFNGDGIDDIVTGDSGSGNGYVLGSSTVVFGTTSGFDPRIDPIALDGSNGFQITNLISPTVGAAGDINGDGFADIVVGDTRRDNYDSQIGKTYVIFGGRRDFNASLDTSELDGTNGFVLEGVVRGDQAGGAVSGTGDINGDGVDDLLISATGTRFFGNINTGQSYIVFGNANGFDATVSLADLDGTNGFTLAAINTNAGTSVSGAGDINGDGLNDFIVGDTDDYDSEDSGRAYVVFGQTEGFSPILNLTELNGFNGFILNGVAANDDAGSAISTAGDINNDGIDDLIVGAPNADPNGRDDAGSSYVVYGNAAPELDLDNGQAGRDAAITFTGEAVAINLNLTVADANSPTLAKATIVITNSLDSASESLAAVVNDTNITAVYDSARSTLTLTGEDTVENYQQALQTVTYSNTSAAPDTTERTIQFVLDDGSGFSNNSTVATTTVSFELLNQVNGTDNADRLTGTPDEDRIRGFGGNDFIRGRSGNDVLIGNSGKDQIFGSRGNDSLYGNRGNDLLNGGSGNDLLRAGQGKDKLFGSRGDDILRGNDGDDLLLGGAGNDRLNGGNGLDLLNGSNGDDFLKGGKGDDRLFGGVGDDTLRGGNGVDLLQGGQGNDRLDSGFGGDSLFGGAGADQFVLRAGNGNNTIFDYQDGVDSFVLDGLDFADLEIQQGLGHTTIQTKNEHTLVTLIGIQASAIEATDFIVLV